MSPGPYRPATQTYRIEGPGACYCYGRRIVEFEVSLRGEVKSPVVKWMLGGHGKEGNAAAAERGDNGGDDDVDDGHVVYYNDNDKKRQSQELLRRK